MLIGGLAAGALTGCRPESVQKAPVTTDRVYTNNFHVAGVGYYHAPFRAWYQVPYNFYEPKSGKYFYGGQWSATPHQSITNISAPTPEVAAQAQAQRTDTPRNVTRSGFGSSSRSYHTWS